MNYIINPLWFYWIQLANGLKIALLVCLGFTCIFTVVSFAYFAANYDVDGFDDDDAVRWFKLMKRGIIILVILCVVSIVMPSKETLIEMQIAKYATFENAEWTLDAIKSAVDYIVEAIKSIK